MNKYTIYVGLNDQDTKRQEIDTRDAFDTVTRIICKYTDGGTIYEARGVYKHMNGTVVVENTLRVELFDVAEKALREIIRRVKKALNQETVAVQSEQVLTQFI